jgi:aspartate-semialdehyde dehydrogenase
MRYCDAIEGRRLVDETSLAYAGEMTVKPADEVTHAILAFSGLSADAAKDIEPVWLMRGVSVCSNASAWRMDEFVPIVLAGVNSGHVHLVRQQHEAHGWKGYLVTNSNCSISGLVTVLAPIREFGILGICCSTWQSLSGAGWPGPPALAALGNVIPFIPGEEEKMAKEARKILGSFDGTSIAHASFVLDAFCVRVPVPVGHLVGATVWFEREPSVEEVTEILTHTPAPLLPSAPEHPIVIRHEPDRPQPALDVRTGNGLTAVVGRLRRTESGALAFAVLADNLMLGAAGAALMNGELLAANGYLDRRPGA